MSDEAKRCPKCSGTGWYTAPNQRGTVHSEVCNACCIAALKAVGNHAGDEDAK